MSLALFVPFVFIKSYAEDRGIGSSAAATLVGVIGGASVVGRLGLGALASPFGSLRVMQASFVIMACSFVLWLVAGSSLVVLVLFAIVMGVGYGGFIALGPGGDRHVVRHARPRRHPGRAVHGGGHRGPDRTAGGGRGDRPRVVRSGHRVGHGVDGGGRRRALHAVAAPYGQRRLTRGEFGRRPHAVMSTDVPMMVSGSRQQLEEPGDVVGRDAETEQTVVDLAGVGRHHLRETSATTVERDVAAGAGLDEATLTKMAPGVGGEVVHATPLGQQTIERRRHANDELVVGSGPIGRADLAGVEVLQHQPAAWCQPGDQLIEDIEPGRDVLQHEPFVNEVPRALRYRSGHDVELPHLELRAAVMLEPSGVEIDRHHVPARPDPGRRASGRWNRPRYRSPGSGRPGRHRRG